MSLVDWFISIWVWLIDNTLGRLPEEYADFPLSRFQLLADSAFSSVVNAWSLAENFIPIKLILILTGVIIFAEIMLHFGWKAIKYLITLIRG